MGQQESWHLGTPNFVTVLAMALTPKDLTKKVCCSMRVAKIEGGEGHHSYDCRRFSLSPKQFTHLSIRYESY